MGISTEKLKTLFERFERGEDTYSKEQEGTGIGLNLTRHLVELNGGRISVDSSVGSGSRFSIMMPAVTGETMIITEAEIPHHEARLDGLSLVVVDDNLDTRNVLKHILEASGASVRLAESVKIAIEYIAQAPPDLVLTDLAIPGESGMVLIQHIRRAPEPLSAIPILVLSACAFEADQRAAIECGGSAFMSKPFKPEEIVASVRQLTLTHAMQSSQSGGQVHV